MARTPGGTLSAFTLLSTPDEPTITSITTSIGSATVAFTPPTDVGDAAVSSYVVTAVDESSGASTGATGSASPITVTPPAGGTFKIRMQALNAYGPGRLTEYDTGNLIYSGTELYAWGLNTKGELGLNNVDGKSSPVQVGALTNWESVAASSNSSFSIKTDNTLWAWGYNEFGQLGLNIWGTAYSRSSPVQVGALTNWATVSSTNNFCIANKSDGTLWAWGRNNVGQLGDGTAVNKSSPVQIGALTNWAQVSAGNSHTASVKVDGTIWTWGFNLSGQLGDNTIVNKSSPIQIGALTDWAKVSAGASSCLAIKTNGTLWSWGANSQGCLGLNISGTLYRSSPVQVGALTNWSLISVFNQSLAIKTDGTLWAWGNNNSGVSGKVGDNSTVNRSSPVQLGSLTTWSNVSAGSSSSFATKTDGTLWAWGNNLSGTLGDNSSVNRSSPIQVGALTNWYGIDAGANHTLALYGVV